MTTWRTAHGSEVGSSHAAMGSSCQDAHVIDFIDDVLFAAVSDGAGSCELSATGAAAACTWAVQYMKSSFTRAFEPSAAVKIMHGAFQCARTELEQLAVREGRPLRDYSCTLLAAMVTDEFSAFAQIGDGASVFRLGGEVLLAHWPEQEMLNLTDFLTAERWQSVVNVRLLPGRVTELAMMSDGLTQLFIDNQGRCPHVPALLPLWAACRQSPDPASLNQDLRAFLASSVVNDRSDDDKTLVIATRMD
ncbi:MAG: PP2C family serine/threonine-protein phosphatase [Phycisphaerae bacterium]|jgi:hypothetical protein